MLTPSENTSASWESNVWAQAVKMARAVPAAVAEKLCQWAGSAVRSLILHHSNAPTTTSKNKFGTILRHFSVQSIC
jgi:hypothetical protein